MNETATSYEWVTSVADGPRTLGEKAYEALHNAIVTGALAPGERLRIEQLAAALNMSHLPIREAIRQLESRGLVEHIPHRGGRVTEISLDDLRQLYDARLVMETGIIRRAARQFTTDDTAFAQAALDRLADAQDRGSSIEIWGAHTNFHFALYEPSASMWLVRLVRPLWESSQRYRLTIPPLDSANRREQAKAEHEEILAACAAHDEEAAARALHNHLVRTENLISDQMGGTPAFELI